MSSPSTSAQTAPTTTAESPRSLRVIALVLATACGLSVANIYYAQPLLALIAKQFHTSQGTATVVVTATQFGYAAGLLILLPLGDLLENRRLASLTLLGTAVALAVAAVAPNLSVFLIACILVGLTSVVAQILIPLAAHLAPPERRGNYIGQVMSGLLLGILLARTVSSFAAAAWGWRSIYVISAVLMVFTSLALRLLLPRRQPAPGLTYRAVLRSIGGLVREQPVLRQRAIGQMLVFACFTAFWTSIAYQLVAIRHFSENQIGLFALVGAAGAGAAPIAGRIGDHGYGRVGRAGSVVLACLAMVLAAVASHSVVLLGLAAVLLDLAVQGHQVLCQRDIYALTEDARSRINTVYMGTVFLGSATASAITGLIHDKWGWSATMLFGAGLAAVSGLLMINRGVRRTGVRSRRPQRRDQPVH